MTLEGTSQRIALNQSSRIGLVDYVSNQKISIWKRGTTRLDCALFVGAPTADTMVSSVANVSQVDLVIRKSNSRGVIIANQTLTSAALDFSVTFAEWAAGAAAQFSFFLSTSQTNQAVAADGTLPIYWSIYVTTGSSRYIGGFGYGQIVDAGIPTNPLPPPPVSLPYDLTVPLNGTTATFTSLGVGAVTAGTITTNTLVGTVNNAINIMDSCGGACIPAIPDNGTIDNTDAIVQHIDYAAARHLMLFIPPGIFKVRTDSLVIKNLGGSVSCRGIIGSGAGSILVSNGTGAIITIDGVGGRLDGLEFGNFTLLNNGSSTTDTGILFSDTSVSPVAENYINKFVLHDINFWDTAYCIRSTRAGITGGETGFNWNTFTRLVIDAPFGKVPRYGIKLDKGSGTHNDFSIINGLVSEAFFSVGDGGGGNVGDLNFMNCQVGSSGDHAIGFQFIGGTNYNANVSIIGCHVDAPVGVSASDMADFTLIGGGWSQDIPLNFLRCDYLTVITNVYPLVNLTNCGPHNILINPRLNKLLGSLTVPQINMGEDAPTGAAATNAQRIWCVPKATVPSGGQGSLIFQSVDVTNPLVANFALASGPNPGDRKWIVGVIDNGVGFAPVEFDVGGCIFGSSAIPSSDPHVVGQLYRTGNAIMISNG